MGGSWVGDTVKPGDGQPAMGGWRPGWADDGQTVTDGLVMEGAGMGLRLAMWAERRGADTF
eukprot:1081658-Prymnesium_polylepis.1